MIILLAGIFIWVGAHFFPAAAPELRARAIAQVGMGTYKAVFALLIFFSIALMVAGWRGAEVQLLYIAPTWGRTVALVLMPLALLLMLSPNLKSNIRRFIPHSQLSGFTLWALLHLLSSGSSRAVVLFACLGVWALLEMLILSRRVSIKAQMQVAAMPITRDVAAVILALLMYAALLVGHGYVAGISLIGI